MKIAILSWGDPGAWRFAKYCYGCSCTEGFSTLDLLQNSRDLAPDTVVIFVLDTLAARAQSQNYQNYGELAGYVREYVNKYVCDKGRERISIKVLPGVMGRSSRDSIEFRANLTDTRLLALYKTYFSVFKLLKSGSSDGVEFVLDTTHGLNYFSILIRESVFEAAAMASAVLGSPVKVSVFNADPMPPGVAAPGRSEKDPCRPVSREPVPRLEYNLLSEVWVYPWDLARYFRYSRGSVSKVLSDPRDCGLDGGEPERLMKFSKLAIASLRVGALVELAELVKREQEFLEKTREMLRKASDCWLQKARIKVEDGVYKTSFTKLQDGFRLLLHAHATFSGVSRVLASEGRADGVSLRTLQELVERLLKGSEIVATLVRNELNWVEARLRREREGGVAELPSEWTPYYKLRSEEVTMPRVECDKPEIYDQQKLERNFVAHAGFLKDTIELKRLDDRNAVFRVRQSCQDAVDGVLEEVFKKLCSGSDRDGNTMERECLE